jgi:Domain of unknown function (DUF4440)
VISSTQHAKSFASKADFIRELEIARTRALVARDMPLLQQLHAEDYQLITPAGRTYTKERYLNEIEAGNLRYLRWETGPMNVRTSEHMAIARYQATLEFDSENGRGTPFECWHTDSYELRGDAWLAVWSQATAIKRTQ